MKTGFALIEILIVVAILAIVLILSVIVFYSLTNKADLDTCRDNIISTLNMARSKTLASEQAAQYGIYFDTTEVPHRYIFFKGADYASRETSFDRAYNLPENVLISDIDVSNNDNQVVFKRLEGNTDNQGSITINSELNGQIRKIYIYSSGETSTQLESASGSGRITDSRHVHFDLGWSILGAETLKFEFVNVGQVEQVPMADYFTNDTEFDWQGSFEVNNAIQEFRIHTHQLSPTTILCIHRDRNQEKNTEEVYIYIIQNEVQKEIAHYDDDQQATVYKGWHVENGMEVQ